MKKYMIIPLLFVLFCNGVRAQDDRRTLTAYLYPYIPDAKACYAKIERIFETQYPDIDLRIELGDDTKPDTLEYYHGGLYRTRADILEIDCIFLDSLIRKNRIMPYPDQNFLKVRADTLDYGGIPYRNGTLYALPHWINGNFLFYHKEDAVIGYAAYLNELEKGLGINRKALATDMSDELTVGEIYADGLYAGNGDKALVAAGLNPELPDTATVNNLKRLLHLTDSLYSLSGDSVNAAIKGFVRGKFRVYAGQAGSCNRILKAIKTLTGIHNLKPEDIAVRDRPLSDKGSHSLGWVDAIGIRSGLTGQKLEDARAFIHLLLSEKGYLSALVPDGNDVPRYLLPAYKRYYRNPAVLEKAPLYRYFLPLAEDMKPLLLHEMNNEILRAAGKKVMEKIVKQ